MHNTLKGHSSSDEGFFIGIKITTLISKFSKSSTLFNIHTYFGTFLEKFIMNYFFQEHFKNIWQLKKIKNKFFFPRTFQELFKNVATLLLNGIENNYTNFRVFQVKHIIQFSYIFCNIFSKNYNELFFSRTFQEHLTIEKNQEQIFFSKNISRTFQERSHPA